MLEVVAMARALADPTRVRIVAALRNGELCVCELVDALGISQSSMLDKRRAAHSKRCHLRCPHRRGSAAFCRCRRTSRIPSYRQVAP